MEIELDGLAILQERLRSIHPGELEAENYLRPWLTPGVLGLLLESGQVLRPDRVRHIEGEPLNCHGNSLAYAGSHPDVRAWWGWRLIRPWWSAVALDGSHDEGLLWWLHSWCLDADGTVLDSERRLPIYDREWGLGLEALYFGVPWGEELFNVLRGFQQAWMHSEQERLRSAQERLDQVKAWLSALAAGFSGAAKREGRGKSSCSIASRRTVRLMLSRLRYLSS